MTASLERLAVATAMYFARLEYGQLRTQAAPLDPESASERAIGVAAAFMAQAGLPGSFTLNEEQELYELLRGTE